MRDEIRMSLAQLPPKAADREENAARLAGIVEAEARDHGATLVVFPQLAGAAHLDGWPPDATGLAAAAEPVPGPTTAALGLSAHDHGVYVIAGILERAGDGSLYDTAAVLGPDGGVLGVYRRTHLRPAERETLAPGDSLGIFETELATIALSVGYDGSFPELARAQALEGAEVVVLLAAVDDAAAGDPEDSLILQCRSRATENFVYYAGCNLALTAGGEEHGSRSVIASCNGEVLADAAGRGEEVVRATLTEKAFREQRMYLTIFRDRRPEAYGLLVEGATSR